MLKINLIALVFIGLVPFLTTGAFGQPNKQKAKVKKQTTSSSNSQKTNAAKRLQTKSNQPTDKKKIKKPATKIHAEKNQDIEVEIVEKPQIKSTSSAETQKDWIGETEKNVKKTTDTQKTSNSNKVKKNQDIEVENDETHRTKNSRTKP